MKEFSSFAGLAQQFMMLGAAEAKVDKALLNASARLVKRRAKQKIGDYQDQAGQFVPWAELADSTQADRVNKGYAHDEPLLRDGTLRDSIEHNADSKVAHVGSNSDIAVYQEMGTETIPPRSFLGGAAVECAPKIVELIGQNYRAYLMGEKVLNGVMLIEREGEGVPFPATFVPPNR